MTLFERVAAFREVFPNPASWPWLVREQDRDVLYGVWVIGNDYKATTPLYGAYPPSYVARVMALFPDVSENLLHAFSGAIPPGPYSRLDVIDRCGVPDLRFHQGDVCQANRVFVDQPRFDLVLADPPYAQADADRYETPMIDRRKALAALAEVTTPGGSCCWLDTCWPMHNKRQWVTVGRILVQRSTNHRARVLSIFERVTA